jgi:ABC-type Fe3+-hydroxamate transport system substrate-binding protein
MRIVDARGRGLEFADGPGRIVSLVPSHTESLFALGAGGLVVGATDYCVHPLAVLREVPRVPATWRSASSARSSGRARAVGRRVRYLALIWKGPYMAVGPDTFARDLLAACGGVNPLPPDGRRYPRVDERAIEGLDPGVILLPTEPSPFAPAEREAPLGLGCAAARSGGVHIVEGELLSWYGPRMERALELFPVLLAPP